MEVCRSEEVWQCVETLQLLQSFVVRGNFTPPRKFHSSIIKVAVTFISKLCEHDAIQLSVKKCRAIFTLALLSKATIERWKFYVILNLITIIYWMWNFVLSTIIKLQQNELTIKHGMRSEHYKGPIK
jgi:hypothetical protein